MFYIVLLHDFFFFHLQRAPYLLTPIGAMAFSYYAGELSQKRKLFFVGFPAWLNDSSRHQASCDIRGRG